MTEGRFETIHNLRPKNWDNRRHWTNWHHLYDCETDHLGRESCPFHDLRSGGQFQYEYGAGGPYNGTIEPQKLNNRADGDRMDLALGGGSGLGKWGNIPFDTEAGRPTPKALIVPRSLAIFTKKNPLKRGLFSEYPYMPEGEPVGRDSRLQGNPVGFKAGGRHAYIGCPTEYIPDPYIKKVDHGRRNGLRCGPFPHDFPAWMPEGGPNRRKKKEVLRPFYVGKHTNTGTALAGDVEWIPDPYSPTKVDGGRRPFRTWHTRTKWSMPTHAPWSTGLCTAEPRKGSTLKLTQENLPGLATSGRMNLTQSIGPEAALAATGGPSALRLPKMKDTQYTLVKQKAG